MSVVDERRNPIRPLLLAYLGQLGAHPLRTKSITAGAYWYWFLEYSIVDGACFSGILCALQEITSNHLAGVPIPRKTQAGKGGAEGKRQRQSPRPIVQLIKHVLHLAKIDVKVLKMFFYGSLISAPMGHVLTGKLQAKMLSYMDGTTAKVARLLSSNLLIAPIQTCGMFSCQCVAHVM